MPFQLAKRGKKKICADYTLKHIYKAYKAEHKKDGFAVDEKTFRRIALYFNKRAIELMLKEGKEFILPFRLGRIRIRKKKTTLRKGILRVDWEQTCKHKTFVYHLNEHSGGYYYRFYWDRRGSNATNKTAYHFNAGRLNDRALAKIIKEGMNDYYL